MCDGHRAYKHLWAYTAACWRGTCVQIIRHVATHPRKQKTVRLGLEPADLVRLRVTLRVRSMLTQRSRRIPIPPNTRNLPASTFAGSPPTGGLATSPTAGFNVRDSPCFTFLSCPNSSSQIHSAIAASTSPRNASHSLSQQPTLARQLTRQLTAFLPAAFPASGSAAEQDGKKHGTIKILLLENISQDAASYLRNQGYEVGV